MVVEGVNVVIWRQGGLNFVQGRKERKEGMKSISGSRLDYLLEHAFAHSRVQSN